MDAIQEARTNPLRLWSVVFNASTYPYTQNVYLYKLVDVTDANSLIAQRIVLKNSDLYFSIIDGTISPQQFNDLQGISLIQKVTNQVIAEWTIDDFGNFPAAFINNTGNGGANYASWNDFLNAINNAISPID